MANPTPRYSGGMAWRATATHCAQGHSFTPENTYRRPDFGWRQCRVCKRERSFERMRRVRAGGA